MTENENKIIEGLTTIANSLMNEVIELKQKSANQDNEIEKLNEIISALVRNQKNLTEALENSKFENKKMAETFIRSINNVPYEISEITGGKYPKPHIVSIGETVDKIINDGASIARYGDGEFSIMMGKSRQNFQHQNERLQKKLIEVIESKEENFLVAIADNYGALYKYNEDISNGIRYYMTDEVRKGHNRFLDMNREYYNAYITLPYRTSSRHDMNGVLDKYDNLKKIWGNRDVIIVEGSLSRLGVGNDLFNNCKSIKRILCPPEQAFDVYDEILSEAIKAGNNNTKDCLFIVSLGPTATVLAYDLYKEGFQAVDLGHIDQDYELYLRKAETLCQIPGKYVNLVSRIEDVEDIDDPIYHEQIICEIVL